MRIISSSVRGCSLFSSGGTVGVVDSLRTGSLILLHLRVADDLLLERILTDAKDCRNMRLVRRLQEEKLLLHELSINPTKQRGTFTIQMVAKLRVNA